MTHRRIVRPVILAVMALLAVSSLHAATGPVFLPLLVSSHAGGVWLEVGAGSASSGGISNNGGRSEVPSLAFAPDGTAYVAWSDSSSRPLQIYVRAWDGTAWREVGDGSASGGGISNTSGDSRWLSMAVAPDGRVWVAWEEWSGDDPAIYVRYWDGSSWREAAGSATGSGISGGGYSRGPSVAVAANGSPYVAWSEKFSVGGWDVYMLRWDGSSWQEVGAGSASGGGISDSGGDSAGPAVAIAPDGVPYVAWGSFRGKGEIYVRRWNGAAWQEVGQSSPSDGGISNTSGESNDACISIGPDGVPYVAWTEDAGGNDEIYVRRWNRLVWQEVGQGSASGGGISDNAGTSETCSVAVSSSNVPYVAWADRSGGDCDQIYVRYWDGVQWRSVGLGAASGGGVSDTEYESWRPSLAVAPDDVPYVAWYDETNENFEIYVRRYIP
jgi:hypothetical protein